MTALDLQKALFHIDYDGKWFHDGAEIKRKALAKLFADKGLKVDSEGRYWLSSPEEKYAVQVDDVPFLIIDYDIQNDGGAQAVDLKTNMDEIVRLGPDCHLEIRPKPQGGINVPYVLVRKGLYARLSRAVYYNLVERAETVGNDLVLQSRGVGHKIGRFS